MYLRKRLIPFPFCFPLLIPPCLSCSSKDEFAAGFCVPSEADLRVTVPFFFVGQIRPWNKASAPEARSSHQCPRWTLVSLRVGVTFGGSIGGVGKTGVKQL